MQEEIELMRQRHQKDQDDFQSIFDDSCKGRKILDTDLMILNANERVSVCLCYSMDELKGKCFLDFIHPDFRIEWQTLGKVIKQKKELVYCRDTCLLKSDGSSFWCHISVMLLTYQNQPCCYLALEDISERKMEELRDREKNSEANWLELREMEKRQHHDLLAVILHTQRKERKRIASRLKNGVLQWLKSIAPALERLENSHIEQKRCRLLRNAKHLVSEAAKETEQMVLELVPASMEHFGLAEAIGDINRILKLNVPVSARIIGDAGLINNSLSGTLFLYIQELVGNAAKHSKARSISLILEIRETEVLLKVTDDGTGFDVKDGLAKEGLLDMMAHHVRALSGSIALESVTGQGTQVRVKLPMK